MKHHFRNDEQQKAFDEWWNSYMKQFFGDKVANIEQNDDAMWVIGIAYQAGLEKMAHTIQDALRLVTTVKVGSF